MYDEMRFPVTAEMVMLPAYRNDEACYKLSGFYAFLLNVLHECGRKSRDEDFHITANFMAKLIEGYFGVAVNHDPLFMRFLELSESGFNAAWQQGVKEAGEVFDIDINRINILPCFSTHPPKQKKMESKEQYFRETGCLQSEIILDGAGNLIDGYTSYLLAKAHGLAFVPVRYGRRQIVRASHKKDGKVYAWELPGLLVGRVSVGEKLIVRTSRGLRTVTVAEVEEYAGQEPEPLRMAIRKPRARREVA